jgi:NAD(P)H-dependent FMN reductase
MKVLGIVGSPRRERGLCHRVVTRVLEGAQSAGAETEILYLRDENPAYCIHCGHSCFTTCDCIQEEAATARSRQVDAAAALVLAAPVYVWQVNGLTAAFFDKLRLSTGAWNRDAQHGRRALGIAVAGGTGTGVFPALQSIYSWLCLWKFRPLEPLPVTRFNLNRALDEAPDLGKQLARPARQPFADPAEIVATYDALPYMNYMHTDEFRWLAQQVWLAKQDDDGSVQICNELGQIIDQGRALEAQGNRVEAARRYIAAYRRGVAAL